MMDGWYDGMGAGGWILMSLLWILLVGAVVWAVAQLFPGRDRGAGRDETPAEILERRLARGEIDVDTYEQVRDKLGAAGPRGGDLR